MQVEIDFSFFSRYDENLDNNSQDVIRTCVVDMLREVGYGEVLMDENYRYTNRYASPFVLGYVGEGEHEIFCGYLFDVTNDTSHGDLGSLLTRGISSLFINLNNRLPNIRLTVRTTYIDV